MLIESMFTSFTVYHLRCDVPGGILGRGGAGDSGEMARRMSELANDHSTEGTGVVPETLARTEPTALGVLG